jgi:hypothetical protein
MKKIMAFVFIFLFLSPNNFCFSTEFLRDLPSKGRIFVSTYLERNGQFLELVYSYQPEQTAQRDYFQIVFDRDYKELLKDGWRKTIFEDSKKLSIAINITYTENDKILGTSIGELKKECAILFPNYCLPITKGIEILYEEIREEENEP